MAPINYSSADENLDPDELLNSMLSASQRPDPSPMSLPGDSWTPSGEQVMSVLPTGLQPDTSFDAAPPQKLALDNTPIDLSQGHGVVQDPRKAAMQGHEDASLSHSDKAAEYLRKALGTGTAISPDQASTAGLLALIPTLAGAIGGALIGRPKLSPHSKFTMADLTNAPTGTAGGAILGSQGGETASAQYLKQLQDHAAQEAKINEVMAGQEFKQADTQQEAANRVQEGGLDFKDKTALETQRISGEKDIENMKLTSAIDPASELGRQAMAEQVGKMADPSKIPPDQIKNFQAAILGQKSPDKALQAFNTATKYIESIQGGGKAGGKASQALENAVAEADKLPGDISLVRDHYQQALASLGPGMANAFARKGLAALPSGAQALLEGDLTTLAISMAKVKNGGRPNQTEVQAITKKLMAAANMNRLDEYLKQEMESAHEGALSHIQTAADFGNDRADAMYDEKSQKWGNDIQTLFGPSIQDIEAEKARRGLK